MPWAIRRLPAARRPAGVDLLRRLVGDDDRDLAHWYAPGRPMVFQVSDDLISRQHAIDGSLQAGNDDPTCSATSVLRAGRS